MTPLRRLLAPFGLASVAASALAGLCLLDAAPLTERDARASRTDAISRRERSAPRESSARRAAVSPAERPGGVRAASPRVPTARPAAKAAPAPQPDALEPVYDAVALREAEALGRRLSALLEPGSPERALVEQALARARARRRNPAAAASTLPELPPSLGPLAEARALGQRYPDPAARARLLLLCGDSDPRARAEAARALSRWSDFAPDLLRRLDEEPDFAVRRVLFAALADHAGAEALEPLAAWLWAGERGVRDVDPAVRAIREIAVRAGVEIPPGLPLTRRQELRLARGDAAPRSRAAEPATREARRRRRGG